MGRTRSALRAPVLGAWKDVTDPVGWTWAHGLSIQRKGRRFRAKGFNISSLAPAAAVTYYVSKSGNDGNTGADWDHALRNLYTAIQKVDVDRIYVGAGTWSRDDGWQGIALTRSCAVIGVGEVILTAHDYGLVWVKEAGLNFTYSTTRASTQGVYDASVLDGNGDVTRYSLQVDSAAVDANAGSWYLDGANKLWVRCVDNRAPDDDIWPVLNAYCGDASGNITIYLENLKFYGGSSCFRHRNTAGGQTPALYAKNCQFRSSSNANGLTLLGVATTILQGCLAAANLGDGFNHHAQNAVVPRVVEIDCTGRHNGLAGDDDNGSSVHDLGSIVRINGRYYGNKGPNVIDAGQLESWNLGTLAHTSAAGAGSVVNFDSSDAGAGAMWCDRCRSYGSVIDFRATGAASTLHKRKCNGAAVDGGAGTIDSY